MTTTGGGVHKVRKGRGRRFLRLIGSTLDPRAWAHFVKVMNYYNYTHVQELRKVRLGPRVAVSPTVGFANGHNVEIGARTTLGADCRLWAGPERARIVIGPDVLFAPDVMVTATNYRYDDGAPVTAQAMDEAEVEIGADCWIGRGAMILPGAKLGEGCIVAAHAVVRGAFAPYSVVAGVPARVVGQRRRPDAPEDDPATDDPVTSGPATGAPAHGGAAPD